MNSGCLKVLAVVFLPSIIFYIIYGIYELYEDHVREVENIEYVELASSYKKACNELDFLKAHEIIEKMYDNYLTIERKGYSYDEKLKDIESKYFAAVDYVYGRELVYMFGLIDSDVEQQILLLMSEFPIVGRCLPEGFTRNPLRSTNPETYEISLYQNSVNSLHKACDRVLSFAIQQNNKTLAKNIVSMYRQYPIIIDGGEGDVIEGVKLEEWKSYIKLDNSASKEAQRKFKNAFK